MTHFKIPWIGKQCKNKWNCVNDDYKKIHDYHKSTINNVSYQDLTLGKWHKVHLPRQFIEKCYNAFSESIFSIPKTYPPHYFFWKNVYYTCFQKCVLDVRTLLMMDHELGQKWITFIPNDVKPNVVILWSLFKKSL
jgi:hypothetical protein